MGSSTLLIVAHGEEHGVVVGCVVWINSPQIDWCPPRNTCGFICTITYTDPTRVRVGAMSQLG